MKVPGSLISIIFSVAILTACGGGGGGSDFVGAGNISVKVTPKVIDTGDRVLVDLNFNELHPDGVIIKIRYDSGLAYIPNTSFWEIDGDKIDGTPDAEAEGDFDNKTFLVYYLDRSLLGDKNNGELSFELRGLTSTRDGSEIEVDIDVLEDGYVFSAEAPEFNPEDSTELEVS